MFYSGEHPNPSLHSFIRRHGSASGDRSTQEPYAVQEFTRPILTSKQSPIFSMHPYHLGKKPHDAIQAYINHYTSAGDLVLDPFCGSGSTALAALLSGRRAIAIDASPAATFISRFYLSETNPDSLAERFNGMSRAVAEEMRYLYGTTCHRCGSEGLIHYLVYSNVYLCPACGNRVTLFEASHMEPAGCPHCRSEHGRTTPITPHERLEGCVPVAVNYRCFGSCRPRRITRSVTGSASEVRGFTEIDLPRIHEIDRTPIPHHYPDRFMMDVSDPSTPWGDEWRPSRNFRRVADLFTHRNLWAIAALFEAAGSDDELRAVLTAGMLAVSRKAQHLKEGGGYIPGNWALPPMSKQRNVLESITKIFGRTITAKRQLAGRIDSSHACISTQSATDLDRITSSSIDYIFTDPPYGGAIQYAELNFIWEAWLGFSPDWHQQEIIVNRTRGSSEERWSEMMEQAMRECRRVLKPGRWLSLCFHDASPGMWMRVREIMRAAGFHVGPSAEAVTIDTQGRSFNQHIRDKAVRRDLVISFQKLEAQHPAGAGNRTQTDPVPPPDPGEIVRAYLAGHPGSTKDRIYDHLVSASLRSGSVELVNFEKLLNKVATSRPGEDSKSMWYVKESEAQAEPLPDRPMR